MINTAATPLFPYSHYPIPSNLYPNPLQPPNNLQHPPNSLLRSTSIPLRGRTKDFWQKSAKQIGNWGSDFSDQLEWLGFGEQFNRKNLFDIFFG